MPTKRILFCTDFSKNSLSARDSAVDMAVAFDAELAILHVVGTGHFGYPSFEDSLKAEMATLRQKIDECVQREMELQSKECRLRVREVKTHLRSGEAADEIVGFAIKHSVDLIVMGTRGWSGLKGLLLGHVTTNVVRTATCPVLVVRSRQ